MRYRFAYQGAPPGAASARFPVSISFTGNGLVSRYNRAMETRVGPSEQTPPNSAFEALPWRIFIDSCTVQTMRRYGEFIYDGGSISDSNKIHQIPNGFENVVALRDICQVTSRALFQWIVSDASRQEARAKGDPDHLQWLYEVAHYARAFLDETGPTPDSEALAARLDEPRFGYLGQGDRILLQDAIFLQCDSFLTMERKRPKNAAHIECELGIRVLTPISYWERLRPWAGLWW